MYAGFTFECRSRKASWQPHYQNNSHLCPFVSHTFASPRRHPLFSCIHRQNTGGWCLWRTATCQHCPGMPSPIAVIRLCIRPVRGERYVTDAGCPNPSCGAAFVSFVYMYSQPQAAATATIATFRTICFSWERSSRLVITPRPQPYRPTRPKSRPRNTVAPRGRNGAVDPGDPCHEPRVGLNCSSIDGFRVA